MWAIHLTATSRVLKSLTSTVGFRGWVAVCGSGNEMDSPLAVFMLRSAGSSTHCRLLLGSGSPALSAAASYCSGTRCIGQRLSGRVPTWGRRCEQRRGIAAHRVRGPQVPVSLQPVLDRYDRLVTLADHRPGARPTGGPDRKTVRHCSHVPSRCRTPADNEME